MISSLPACRGDPGEYWWLPWCVATGSLCCTARSTQFPLSLFCSTSTRWPCLFSAFPRVVCSGSWAGWAPKYQCKYFGWLELEFVFIGLVLAVGIDGHRRRGFGKGEILDVRHIIKSIHPFWYHWVNLSTNTDLCWGLSSEGLFHLSIYIKLNTTRLAVNQIK